MDTQIGGRLPPRSQLALLLCMSGRVPPNYTVGRSIGERLAAHSAAVAYLGRSDRQWAAEDFLLQRQRVVACTAKHAARACVKSLPSLCPEPVWANDRLPSENGTTARTVSYGYVFHTAGRQVGNVLAIAGTPDPRLQLLRHLQWSSERQ